jgi:TRAP-type mannitol/chloroaromatic compound transport system permease small subunit
MAKLAGWLDALNIAVGGVVRWCALLMVLIQFALVILRYVFSISFIYLNESVLYLHGALFMLGAGYTLLVNEHVRVDIFYAKVSVRGQAIIDVFGHIFLLLPAMAVLAWFTWPSVRSSWVILEGPISVGGIPASFLLKSLIPAFCILLIFQGIACLIRDVLRLRHD